MQPLLTDINTIQQIKTLAYSDEWSVLTCISLFVGMGRAG